MTREQARQRILGRATEYFKRDKSGKGYICPICGSGNGEHGTGITENPKKKGHFTCWAGCFTNADIFEIIGKHYFLSDFADQFEKACELFGVTPDKHGETVNMAGVKKDSEDFTEFLKSASKRIEETDYHRGISLETLKRFGVGYEPNWKQPNSKSTYTTPRLIIPNDAGSYLARDTRANLTDKERGYSKQRPKNGHVGLFNGKALRDSKQPVFITEGELDALSIIDAGGEAVALCSTSNAGKLIDAVKRYKPEVPLLLTLDNDESGVRATSEIKEGLKQLTFSSYRKWPLPQGYKDANEFLLADRQAFGEWVKAGINTAYEPESEENGESENESFERESVAYHLPEFLAMLKDNRERPAISTGFENLDDILGGGLYAGLYFVGAISSLGKTTFCLQVCDNVAKSGHGVLIFSLEMARSELIAKSLSRLSFLKSHELYQTGKHAKTTRGILRGYFGKEEESVLMASLQEYSEYGKYIHVTEGIGNIGVAHVREKVEEYIRHVGKPPVILIDYVQILQIPECRHSLTDKQAVDKNVVELKRISRDYDTPVIGISSFNRENYSAPVNMTSFKESGSVEYSSDVLIGLQYNGWDYQKDEKDTARHYRLRQIRESNELIAKNLGAQGIQLKVLKNRNGKRGSCCFNFWTAFNYFCPAEE